jgi:hypothetical protein
MQELVGQTVIGIAVSKDQQFMMFNIRNAPPCLYATEADCCSETWFAEINGVEALIGRKVLEVKEMGLPDPTEDDGHGRQEQDSFYGIELVTRVGTCRIVFRNSSNGYYGGSVRLVPSDGGYRPTPSSKDWDTVTQDWTAY